MRWRKNFLSCAKDFFFTLLVFGVLAVSTPTGLAGLPGASGDVLPNGKNLEVSQPRIVPQYFFKLFHIWKKKGDFDVYFPPPPWQRRLVSKKKREGHLSRDEAELLERYQAYKGMVNDFDTRDLEEHLAETFRRRLNGSEHFYIPQRCKSKECIGFRLGMSFTPVRDQYTLKLECVVKFYLGKQKTPFTTWGKGKAVIYIGNKNDPFREALDKTMQLVDTEELSQKLGKEKKYNRLFLLFSYKPDSPKRDIIEKKRAALVQKKITTEVVQKPDGSTALAVTKESAIDFIRRRPRIVFEVDKVSDSEVRGPFQVNFGTGDCIPFYRGENSSQEEYRIKAIFNPRNNCYDVDPDNELGRLIKAHPGIFSEFYKNYKKHVQFSKGGKGGGND